MKVLRRWRTIAWLALALIAGRPSLSSAVEDAIIAVVNDELITLKDLKDYVRSTYVSLVAEGMDDAQLQVVMDDMEVNGIDKLIEDKLILSKANAVGLEVREGLVDERVETIKRKYGSEQQLVDALVRNGSTLTDLRNKIRDQLKIKYVIDHEVKSKIYVNPQEVTDFYEKNKDRFNSQDRVNLESVFIPYGSDKDAAQAKAKEALKRIESGEDFRDIVREYSQAPSVGTVERGQLLPGVEKIVFRLKVDEVSPPVEVDSGIYIFKLTGRSPATVSGLEDVKETIYDLLFKEKFKNRFMRWTEKLKNEAYIEIKQ